MRRHTPDRPGIGRRSVFAGGAFVALGVAAALGGASAASQRPAAARGAHLAMAASDRIAVSRVNGRIVLIAPSGRRIATLTAHPGWADWAPAWSPDGSRIAFTRSTDGRMSFRIFVMRANRGGVRRLTRGRFDDQAAWSPDGRWIAYVSPPSDLAKPAAVRRAGIRLVRPDGTGDHLVIGGWGPAFPSWTPEGRLAYTLHPEEPGSWPASCRRLRARCGWVWTARANGTDRRPLVHGRDAHWSPDGKTVVYTPPNGGVAVVRSDGRRPRVLSHGYLPAWSADGSRIVFARMGLTAAGDRVWLMNRDGTGRRLVMRGASDPAWRPAR